MREDILGTASPERPFVNPSRTFHLDDWVHPMVLLERPWGGRRIPGVRRFADTVPIRFSVAREVPSVRPRLGAPSREGSRRAVAIEVAESL